MDKLLGEEAFRERGKELCEKVLGDQCDFRIFWENVKNSTGKFVKRKMENKAPTEDEDFWDNVGHEDSESFREENVYSDYDREEDNEI